MSFKTKPLVIVGSARSDSNTLKLVNEVFAPGEANIMDLQNFFFEGYSYSQRYPANDEFNQLARAVHEAQTIVFATPVYWYAMSGIMKTFFDRLTDLTERHKAMGKQLAGKHTFLLSVGASPELPEGFEVPFRNSSIYFDMQYQGMLYRDTSANKLPKNFEDQVCRFRKKVLKLLH